MIKKKRHLGKRGISKEIEIVLIILLILAIIILLWNLIMNLLKEKSNESQVSIECLQIGLVLKKACYNSTLKEIQLDIYSGFSKSNISKIMSIVSFKNPLNGISEVHAWKFGNDVCKDVRVNDNEYGFFVQILDKMETRKYDIDLSPDDLKILDPQSVEIYPIIIKSNKEYLCAMKDKKNIAETCS